MMRVMLLLVMMMMVLCKSVRRRRGRQDTDRPDQRPGDGQGPDIQEWTFYAAHSRSHPPFLFLSLAGSTCRLDALADMHLAHSAVRRESCRWVHSVQKVS